MCTGHVSATIGCSTPKPACGLWFPTDRVAVLSQDRGARLLCHLRWSELVDRSISTDCAAAKASEATTSDPGKVQDLGFRMTDKNILIGQFCSKRNEESTAVKPILEKLPRIQRLLGPTIPAVSEPEELVVRRGEGT